MVATTAPSHRHRPAPFIVHDPAFSEVTGPEPRLCRLCRCDAHEGPVYSAAEHALYFTTRPRPRGWGEPPRVAIKRLDLDEDLLSASPDGLFTVSRDANVANGMARDRHGDLIVCEQGSRREPARITRRSPDGQDRVTLVDDFHGAPLNSPNDVIVARDGSIWFTDPSYGFLQGFRPEPRLQDAVYRLDGRTGSVSAVVTGLDKPNGLALSPDERTLYVTDSGANQEMGSFYPSRPHEVRSFPVSHGRVEGPGRTFAKIAPGLPDGIKVDGEGRVYVSSFTGVQVFSAAGVRLGEIRLTGPVNFTFAGTRLDTLLITTDTAVWAAHLNASGAPAPPVTHTKGA